MNERDDLFSITKKEVLPYEKVDNVHVSVTIEVNLTLQKFERSIYTVFDLLSDIGGLTEMFLATFSIVLVIWNFSSLDNFMVTKLFKI